jgi:TonB family protein
MITHSIFLLLILTTPAVSTVAQTADQPKADAGQISASNDPAVEILTADLDPSDVATLQNTYLPRLASQIREAWLPLVPAKAKQPQLKQGKVAIVFHLAADGKVSTMRLTTPSGDVSLDRAAWGAITSSSPFPPFPPGMRANALDLRFNFRYNVN